MPGEEINVVMIRKRLIFCGIIFSHIRLNNHMRLTLRFPLIK